MFKVDFSHFENKIDKVSFEKTLIEISVKSAEDVVFFLDNVEQPEVFFFIRRGVEAVLVSRGNVESSYLNKVAELFKEHSAIVLMSDDPEFQRLMSENYGFGVVERLSFQYAPLSPRIVQPVGDGLELKRIDLSLAKRIEGEIDPDFRLFWNSPDDFIEAGGSGLCLLRNGEIVACTWSSYTTDKNVEIAVATREDSRQSGFASLICSHYINQLLSEGRVPWWSCHKSNKASIALAKKLGFQVLQNYSWMFAPRK
ncbi:hypothetical protein CS022_19510 [Veronia nyctiphanis]|uniref:N-acetyltransferase domain-containing protein n=1 Tax=Veronia nyctiphanis TaxID=1278244 RepID=A0A4Q0YLU8_9GAMM|nr:GNAT family N-acetyltransferase [Veronia nyctiphanis]RXJ71760.1 hypothetical protein CS022_19510 [Veronia nyctiphanis]